MPYWRLWERNIGGVQIGGFGGIPILNGWVKFEMSGMIHRPEPYLQALVRRYFRPRRHGNSLYLHLRLLKAYFPVQATAVIILATIAGLD